MSILTDKVRLIRCFYCETVIVRPGMKAHMLGGWIECHDCHEYRLGITEENRHA